MGIINLAKRTAASVPTPDSGRVALFGDSATGMPQAKDSSGTVYNFVGPNGVRGSQWTYGTAVPSAAALAGDMYLRTTTSDVYQSTGGTSWALIGNFQGIQGPAVPLATSTPADVSASASAPGSATTASKSDHTHFHGNQAGGALHAAAVAGGANGFLLGTDKSKIDAIGAPATTSTDVSGSASAAGVSTNLARQDHTHFHGNQAGGALHAVATTAIAGFMSAADKSLFNNAQANSVNILDFGGNTGGTVDNSGAVNAAVAALGSAGGVIFFPNGDYNFTSPVTVSVGGVSFVGASRNNTRLKCSFATGDFITFNEYYQGISNMQLFSPTTRTSGYMIQAVQPYFRAQQLLIYGTQSTGLLFGGIELGTTSILSSVDDVEVRHWSGVAVSVNGAGDKLINRLVTDNVAANTASAGIKVTNTASLLITNSNIIHAGNALDIAPATGVTIPSVKAINCFFDTSVNGVNMTTAGSWFRSEFTNCWMSSMTNAGINMLPTTANGVNGITFVNCDILQNVGGTTIGINTNANVGKWRISSSQVAGWTTGINLVAGSNHYPSMTNNSIGSIAAFGVNSTGINVAAGTYKGISIRNNDLADNTIAMLVPAGVLASTPDLLEIGNNPGHMQQGALASLATAASATQTETILLQARVPANALTVGQTLRIRLYGGNSGTTVPTLRVRVGTAGTVAGDTAGPPIQVAPATGTGAGVYFEGMITVRSLGTTGTVIGSANIVNGTVTAVQAVGTSVPITVNTTAVLFVSLTGVVATSGTLTAFIASIEAL